MKITESRLRSIIRQELREATIGSFAEDITIVVDVSKTRHATERQSRHKEPITDEEIIATAEEATDQIITQLLHDKIDIDDELVIRDQTYDLNLVCALEPKGDDVFKLIVITVMRKKNFKPKSGSRVIDIY